MSLNCVKKALNCTGLLLARASVGYLMVFGHGLGKVQNFSDYAEKFPDPFGLGSRNSLILCIVGEVVAPAMVALGLFTRPAALAAAFTMGVAAFVAHANDPLFIPMGGGPAKELALLYMIPFALFVFTGPGKISLDALFFRGKSGSCSTGHAGASCASAGSTSAATPSKGGEGPKNMV